MMNKAVSKELWKNKEYYSKGKRGFIYISAYLGKKYVIKTKNPESTATNTIFREYENNIFLNKYNIGPEVYYYAAENDFVVREFVEGETFFEWIKKIKNKKYVLKVLLDVLEQCKIMDFAKINKLEMNHPHKDLLVANNKPVIIDFERCKKTLKPKNVTQFCQFLVSGNMKITLDVFQVKINKEKIILLAEEYKKELIKKTNKENIIFEKIKKELIKGF